MPIYHLDTNICITFLREGKKADTVRRKILLHTRRNIAIPAVVSAELMYGASKSNNADNKDKVERFLRKFEIVPLDFEVSRAYGDIRTALERKGQRIGYHDMLIAATALTFRAVLVTNNTREFSRIDGLLLDDWTI